MTAHSSQQQPTVPLQGDKPMLVQDLMAHPAITCHVNDGLDSAAQKMWDHDCGALPIVNDDGTVTGMITDRDVCMAALTQGRPIHELLVNVAMSKHVVTVGPAQTVGDAEQLMSRHQLRRLPVIDAAGRPIGVISLNGIAIEAVRPDSRMKHGVSKIAHTLAAVCQPHATTQKAA
jgi:CBS domain-containing protein